LSAASNADTNGKIKCVCPTIQNSSILLFTVESLTISSNGVHQHQLHWLLHRCFITCTTADDL